MGLGGPNALYGGILFTVFDYRRSKCAGPPVLCSLSRQATEQHAVILFVSKPQLLSNWRLSTDRRRHSSTSVTFFRGEPKPSKGDRPPRRCAARCAKSIRLRTNPLAPHSRLAADHMFRFFCVTSVRGNWIGQLVFATRERIRSNIVAGPKEIPS